MGIWGFTSSFASREYSRYDEFLTSVAISHIWKKSPSPHLFPEECLIILPIKVVVKNMTNWFHSMKKWVKILYLAVLGCTGLYWAALGPAWL